MLGLSAQHHSWRWKAVGKHPAAADYIHVGDSTPLMEALADWMTKGYDQWQRSRPNSHEPCSWRFWLRGAQKGQLICGVGRDSSDRIGRPFPLLVVGEGPLKEWELRWPLLPSRLAKTWGRIERFAVHHYEDLKALADALGQLEAPGQEGEAADPGMESAGGDPWQACQADLRRSGRAIVALNDSGGMDSSQTALSWHAGLKACCDDIPRAVFLGGSPRQAYLAVILQPLGTADFVRLWSVA
ncbi:MAG: type VI secretion system-associated protein TagF [Desulfatitalea sp.]